jgi:AcrR family transcriptional regulator
LYEDYIKRKEKIIISAIELLNEGGIQGLTTKELAKRQGITEPAIYRQFESKQEIIITILERFAHFDETICNTILEMGMPPSQGIVYYTESFASYYENYPELTTVLFSLDVFYYQKETNDKMMDIMKRRHQFISNLFERGIKDGEFKNQISSEEFSEILLGIVWATIFNWKIGGRNTELRSSIVQRTKWVLDHVLS